MEIYYCTHCGTKIDSDALAHGDAVKRGLDEVYCRGCLPKGVPGATPAAPAKPATRSHVPVRTPLRPDRTPHNLHAQPHPDKTAQAGMGVPPKTFAMIVMGLGALILIAGVAVMMKGKGESEKLPEKTTEKPAEVKPPDTQAALLKPAPTIEKPKAEDLETQAYNVYSAITQASKDNSPKENVDAFNNFLEHYPNSSLGPRARVELSRFQKVLKAMADGVIVVGTAEEGEDWFFHDGGEFPGAKGSREYDTADKKEGARSIKLTGDFTGGGSYVCTGRNMSGTPAEALAALPFSRFGSLRFWIRCPVAKSISFRITDNSDQCHQESLQITPKPEWQQVELKTLNHGSRYSHWGGKNDGQFYWPIRSVVFMLTNPGDDWAKKAEINIDQVEVVIKP
jgi:hypothetical protein